MKRTNIDVGIIVIIPEELNQLLKTFNIGENNRINLIDNHFVYYQFSLPTQTRNITGVISCLNGKSGNIESSLCTSYFFRNWNPKLMCLLGIAAGIENKVKVGDVVIPYKIHDITIKTFENNDFKNRAKTYTRNDEINKMLKTKLHNFNSDFDIKDGSIGADNILIKDDQYFPKFLFTIDEECKGGEMEAAGFVRTCEIEENTPWIIIRGISDFGKGKTDNDQAIAAKNASIVLKYFIENCLDVDKITIRKEKVANVYMEDYFERNLEISYSKRNWREVCEIDNIVSRYLLLTGQYKLRISLGCKSLRAANEGAMLNYKCNILIDDLGWTYYLLYLETHNKDYKTIAIKNIKDGIKIAKEIKDYYILSKGYRHLASFDRQENKFDVATRNLSNSKKYMLLVENSSKKSELESVLLLSKSKLYYAKFKMNGDEAYKEKFIEKCINLALQAEQKYMELKDYERLIKVYRFLSEVFRNSGKDELSRNYLVKMDDLMKQIGRVLYWN